MLVQTVADLIGSALFSASLYERLESAYLGTAEALAVALEAKDAYTAEHARSIVDQAEAVGRRLGMQEPELKDLRLGAAFHDIGKIAIAESILNKRGPLTPEERATLEQHTVIGEQILAPVEFLASVRRLVRHEHERWDGGGYPDGLDRRGDPARLADHPRLRRAARDDVGPPVPQGDVRRGGLRRAAPPLRHAVRPARGRGAAGDRLTCSATRWASRCATRAACCTAGARSASRRSRTAGSTGWRASRSAAPRTTTSA